MRTRCQVCGCPIRRSIGTLLALVSLGSGLGLGWLLIAVLHI